MHSDDGVFARVESFEKIDRSVINYSVYNLIWGGDSNLLLTGINNLLNSALICHSPSF